MIHNDIKPCETMLTLVGKLTNEVGHAIENALTSVCKSDYEAAIPVIAMNPIIELLIQYALSHQFKQMYSLAQRIAYLQEKPVEKSEVSKSPKVD